VLHGHDGLVTCTVTFVTLHAALAAELRRQIMSGELQVGDPLPSEARLCEQWGASRGPVRQALAALRMEGLIGGGRGAPPVVRSRQVAQPFENLMSFTRWAEMAGRTPGQRTIEVSRRPASPAVADALGLEEGEPVVELLRLRLLDGEPAMVERSALPLDFGLPLLSVDLDVESIYATLVEAGTSPVSAHHAFDAVAADDTDAELLAIAPGAPLLRERRHARTQSGEIVEYGEDRYRPDLVAFTVVNVAESHSAFSRTWSRDAS
jgi:GntR family transcriptional regulator